MEQNLKLDSILFIRRDNIGDLVCTTPAINAVRKAFPAARISVLVNSYNAGALKGNPDIDEVFVYEKGKHSSRNRLSVLASNAALLWSIRRKKFDVAIGCGNSWSKRVARYSFFTGARKRIGYVPAGKKVSRLFYNAPVPEPSQAVHEVEAAMGLLSPLGITGPAPRLAVYADKGEIEKCGRSLGLSGKHGTLVAFHISSRKPRNRWPRESFKALGDRIRNELGFEIMLLWAPGKSENPLHPGDDDKAEWLLANMETKPFAYRTKSLDELTAALSLAEMVVCCDGGAMHLAAGLGKPILTIWGTTDPRQWAPWGVPNVILKKGKGAAETTPEEAFAGVKYLLEKCKMSGR